MKRLFSIIFLILILSSVFAEDFIVGEEQPQQDPSDAVEMAQLQAQLINLNTKMENIKENNISKEDINGIRDEFFSYGEGMLNYFLAQVLLMLGVVMVFFFVLTFIFKAKKWL